MKKTFLPIFLIVASITHGFSQNPIDNGINSITKNALKAQLTFISSDWFEGREAGSEGAYKAADYLASLFQSENLSPYHSDSYFQTVPLIAYTTTNQLLKISESTSTNRSTLTFSEEDFSPSNIDRSINLEGKIFFAGYGISQDSFNEIKNNKSSGKIMLRLTGIPGETDSTSVAFQKFKKFDAHYWHQHKQNTAQKAGVVAILEFNPNHPVFNIPDRDNTQKAPCEKIITRKSSGIYRKQIKLANHSNTSIPVIKISENVMAALLPNYKTIFEAYQQNASNLKKSSKVTISPEISFQASVKTKAFECRNVIAKIEGSEKPDEIIVVGAHYDHLGNYDGYIWNGADDNGSGAIGMMAIAKAFAATGVRPKRTVIFASWTAEERGLFGSKYFLNTFKKTDQIKYYHNYDMIGRSYNPEKPDSAVALLYTKNWHQAEAHVKKANETYQLGLKVNYSAWDDPTSGSDNAPFAKKGIPIMWFHTGGHPDYHMPSDHADKIDWTKFQNIVKASFATLWELANE
ncbi:M20/M25/M40 family metallo-hydrolase [Marinilabiliaceae bacterium JC017]|nr:M20/M25/M40 family metallo-hydrolase [Marinilabiliaceae bacterium JC017]